MKKNIVILISLTLPLVELLAFLYIYWKEDNVRTSI